MDIHDIVRNNVIYAVICAKDEEWKPKEQKLEKE
jgi:hypothetical protein